MSKKYVYKSANECWAYYFNTIEDALSVVIANGDEWLLSQGKIAMQKGISHDEDWRNIEWVEDINFIIQSQQDIEVLKEMIKPANSSNVEDLHKDENPIQSWMIEELEVVISKYTGDLACAEILGCLDFASKKFFQEECVVND